MNKTNLAFIEENKINSVPDWNYYVSEISSVFRFTEEETEWFMNCKTAQLIAVRKFILGNEKSDIFKKIFIANSLIFHNSISYIDYCNNPYYNKW